MGLSLPQIQDPPAPWARCSCHSQVIHEGLDGAVGHQSCSIKVSMDKTAFVILLFTGFCVASASFPNIYYFVREKMTWQKARAYCISEHTELVQILSTENVTTMMNTPTRGYTDKAWMGLYENTTKWTWVDETIAKYSNWKTGQPDNVHANEFCVTMNNDGYWNDCNCSEVKPSVCYSDNGDPNYLIVDKQMNWADAKTSCEENGLTLATIPDGKTNSEIQKQLSSVPEAWIGLSRPKHWLWSDTGRIYRYINWQQGQPDNLKGGESCAVVVMEDGTWADEQCKAAYPFFCYGVYKTLKTAVRMKIQTSANMEDPACSADLQRQMLVDPVRVTPRKMHHGIVHTQKGYYISASGAAESGSMISAAARVLTKTRRDHISPVLRSVHWLPVCQRIDFKILLLVYKALNTIWPKYFSDLLLRYKVMSQN
ncbi:C-type mannose receptor 2-like isoform X2 [Siniperca chuatsi]|uniref:C-type mannose receptor 2-like isoform X2 n=1 Tax=Siniperca chuatsi TaxID=119488 RepID=UPI001CE05117|nr:C-type mannose receptor 2-like isoform X2 [Siniperca chuatsi]